MRRALLYGSLLLSLLGLWKVPRVDAGGTGQQAAASPGHEATLPSGYAGSDACEPCHHELADKFLSSCFLQTSFFDLSA